MTRPIAVGLIATLLLAWDSHSPTPRQSAARAAGARLARVSASAVTASSKIVSFETMYGVDEAFVKHNQIRGVRGDELPWEVGSAVGSLTVGGHLTISVRGIVFSSD